MRRTPSQKPALNRCGDGAWPLSNSTAAIITGPLLLCDKGIVVDHEIPSMVSFAQST
jgi:hypothetical protein